MSLYPDSVEREIADKPIARRTSDSAVKGARQEITDVKDALNTDKSDEQEEWMDDSAWPDDFVSDDTMMFADDAEEVMMEEDDYDYDDDGGDYDDGDYDDDDDEYKMYTGRTPAKQRKRVKSGIIDEDEMDDDELAEYLTWR